MKHGQKNIKLLSLVFHGFSGLYCNSVTTVIVICTHLQPNWKFNCKSFAGEIMCMSEPSDGEVRQISPLSEDVCKDTYCINQVN